VATCVSSTYAVTVTGDVPAAVIFIVWADDVEYDIAPLCASQPWLSPFSIFTVVQFPPELAENFAVYPISSLDIRTHASNVPTVTYVGATVVISDESAEEPS
jgi:hypothetical protein